MTFSTRTKEEVEILEKGILAIQTLIDESRGVVGLHLNGDIAPWTELQTGGQYEEWLVDFDKAVELLEYSL